MVPCGRERQLAAQRQTGPEAEQKAPSQAQPQLAPGPPERLKIIVLDDDPTGSQTVHSCPLLLRWTPQALAAGLAHPSPLLFLLANSRGLAAPEAAERVRQICKALTAALAAARQAGVIDRWLLLSRGDSTLRGHFPLESELLQAELGPFDTTLLVPAFLPGGRTTVAGEHRLHGQPVHTSAFAQDRQFGYSTSYLPAWVEQKSGGRWPAQQVQRIGLAELDAAAAELAGQQLTAPQQAAELSEQKLALPRPADQELAAAPALQQPLAAGGYGLLQQRLAGFANNVCVVVDGERPEQLSALAAAVRQLTAPTAAAAWGRPRRLLAQCAASWIEALAALPPQPLSRQGLVGLRRRDSAGAPLPGLVLVGSHVPLADSQLARLLAQPACAGVELDVALVARLLATAEPGPQLAALAADLAAQLQRLLVPGQTPVLFTSRGEFSCRDAAERWALGEALATLMGRLAGRLAPGLGYLISKGGITSHTLLADGLALDRVELQGQLLPGLSLVLTPAEAAVAGLPVLTMPGNLGDADCLAQAWALLENSSIG
jgi:uncharacterized protein YgbK (DUF1537 family)